MRLHTRPAARSRARLLAWCTAVGALAMLAATLPGEAFDSPLQGVNITGTWVRYGGFSRRGVDPRYAAPPPGKMVLRPQYAKAYNAKTKEEEAAAASGQPIADPGVNCLPYGMPEMMSAIYPLEILQTPGQVTIVAEAFSQVRRIFLDAQQFKIGDFPPGYYGHSVGHWEGDTLVVDTIGIKPSVLGHDEMPHSDQLRITERIRLVSPDILHDEITVQDPVTLVKPWTFTFAYKRDPHYQMQEYVCENNHEYIDESGVQHVRLQDEMPK